MDLQLTETRNGVSVVALGRVLAQQALVMNRPGQLRGHFRLARSRGLYSCLR